MCIWLINHQFFLLSLIFVDHDPGNGEQGATDTISAWATIWMIMVYHIVPSKRSCLNKHTPRTFWWIIPLQIGGELVKSEQKWLENLYNVNPPGCLSMRREHLFAALWYYNIEWYLFHWYWHVGGTKCWGSFYTRQPSVDISVICVMTEGFI